MRHGYTHHPRHRLLSACLAVGLLSGACSPAPTYDTTLRWTSFGIPHVTAHDWASLGYGFAYATATDAVCVIARDIAMVNGALSEHFGTAPEHLASDIFHRAVLDAPKVDEFNAAQSRRGRDFQRGYVAGYNRYLRDQQGSLPASCRDATWVRAIDDTDVSRLSIGVGIRYGLGRFQQEIAGAAPPAVASSQDAPMSRPAAQTDWHLPQGIGSNAVAIGSALSASGRGILLGNPHYPWHGSSRFHLIHTTLPGEVDVMGSSLLTTSRVAIGFNADIAWTHTVSTALRFTLYALELNPENPFEYRYENVYRPMQARRVNVKVREADGSTTQATHEVYFTHYGPVIENPQLPWSETRAYAIRDAVIDNYVTADTYDALNRARSTAEVEAAISQQGVYWTNTIAADRHGNAFYADISGTPNIDQTLLDTCRIAVEGLPDSLVVLRGDQARCEWREDPRSAVPGALPAADMPRLTRTDYVTNSNDSYWLANPAAPLEGYPATIGNERTARSLRTRAGLHMLAEMTANDARLSPDDLQQMLYNHRNFGAELVLDDVLQACMSATDLREVCDVLQNWDRTMNVNSVGSHVWREFWDTARHIEQLWATPFDARDPVNTPAGLRWTDPVVRDALLGALRQARTTLQESEIALDAKLGDIQYATRNGEHIPVPGGEGWAGMFSMIVTRLNPGQGYTPIIHGNSYVQVVSWDAEGRVRPSAMLTYSQSPEPDSDHYSDLTRLYAAGEWITLPFTDAEIAADPNLRTLRLTEP